MFTIHNVEYQGRYGDQVLEDVIGLGRNYFNEGMLAHQGDVNLMKGAIMASTYVTTVSPTYAQELRLPFYAHGMDGVINQQSGKLQGILNGIDMALYDPAVMPGLAANFTPAAPAKGKTACKLALQRKVGLREDESAPIIACVSRLVGTRVFLWSRTSSIRSWRWMCRWWCWVPATGSMRRHFEMPSVSIPAASPHRSPTPAPCPT